VNRDEIVNMAKSYFHLFEGGEYGLLFRYEDYEGHEVKVREKNGDFAWVDPLILSIAKWLWIAERNYQKSANGNSCALCIAYCGCEDCDVYLNTGDIQCTATPYYRWDYDRNPENAEDMAFFLIDLAKVKFAVPQKEEA